jgi:hypothetical protein
MCSVQAPAQHLISTRTTAAAAQPSPAGQAPAAVPSFLLRPGCHPITPVHTHRSWKYQVPWQQGPCGNTPPPYLLVKPQPLCPALCRALAATQVAQPQHGARLSQQQLQQLLCGAAQLLAGRGKRCLQHTWRHHQQSLQSGSTCRHIRDEEQQLHNAARKACQNATRG